MSEEVAPQEVLKPEFPFLPDVPYAWLSDLEYEAAFREKLIGISEKYYLDSTPYLAKNESRKRLSQPTESELQWFAGFIDEGVRIGFDRNGKYYTPVFAREETDYPVKVSALLRMGGNIAGTESRNNIVPRTTDWRWNVRGQNAVYLAEEIGPYLKGKKELIKFLFDWNNSSDTLERAQIAESSRDINTECQLTERFHPSYLAGCFESSGAISTRMSKGKIYLDVSLYLNDEEMADYFYTNFKGSVDEHIFQESEIFGRKINSSRGQYVWRAGGVIAAEFLENIRPSLWLTGNMADEALMNI